MKNMLCKGIAAAGFLALASTIGLHAQEFRVFSRTVQVHGFGTQGFVHTGENNWLTMNTTNVGSGEFTDFGANATVPLFDKVRVGAQIYEHNVGQLGKWHPQLDWASADYKFKTWLSFRGGKVKTAMGLYNDTQDMDSLHVFALLPQSVYPIDMRDATLAHLGGDLYGTIKPEKKLGSFGYTLYGGDRRDSIYGGYPYLLQIHGISMQQYGGPVMGGDLRWNTPVKGFTAGTSYVYEIITGTGQLNPSIALGGPNIVVPYKEWSNNDFMNQYYGTWSSRSGKLRLDSEYRRYWRDQDIFSGQFWVTTDVRSWYVAGSYGINKWLEVGSYYSYFTNNWNCDVPGQIPAPSASSPDRHVYDKAVTARINLKNYWYAKVEGHFMDGYAGFMYPDGFYPQVNPQGLKPNTNGVVVRTGMYF
jgi:hypothetical protein